MTYKDLGPDKRPGPCSHKPYNPRGREMLNKYINVYKFNSGDSRKRSNLLSLGTNPTGVAESKRERAPS